jgi:NTP pyrophosphatase (non-canonical NTP hydrolase)
MKGDLQRMDILKLQHKAWEIAEKSGWHLGRELQFGEFIALCHSELSEALEIYRKTGERGITQTFREESEIYGVEKPVGIPIELADVVLRIFDYCETKGIPLHEMLEVKCKFNEKRSHRHGGKVI